MKALISFFVSAALLFTALFPHILPEAKYYLMYHSAFYDGEDKTALEYDDEIPYGDYIHDTDTAKAGSALGFAEVFDSAKLGGVQQAVDAAGQNGGVALISADETVSGLTLRSNVCLFIPSGVTLTVTGHYVRDCEDANASDSSPDAYRFIEAVDARNILITGGGTIAGTRRAYWNAPNLVCVTSPPDTYDIRVLEYLHFQQKYTRRKDISTKLIVFLSCSEVTVSDIVIYDSPGWNISFEACEGVKVDHTVINSNYHGPNTDGIDISATSGALVEDCCISCGDDGVCLKNDKYYAGRQVEQMSGITVRDCVIRSATNGFKIGTGLYNDIRGVTVSGLRIESGPLYPGTISGISLEVCDGGTLSDVKVSDIDISGALAPLFIRLSDRNKFSDKPMTGALSGIEISGVTASEAQLPVIVSGVKRDCGALYARDITIDGMDITYSATPRPDSLSRTTDGDVKEAAGDYPEAWMMGDVPACGVYVRHAANVVLRNLTVRPGPGDKRQTAAFCDVSGCAYYPHPG